MPLLQACTCKDKGNKQEDSQRNKWLDDHARRQASKRCQTRAYNHVKHMKKQTSMLLNKRWCPRRINIGLDWVSVVPLDWNIDDTQTHVWTCRQVCKEAKKQRSKESQVGGAKEARQAYQHLTERKKVWIKHTNTTRVYLISGYIKKNPRRDECDHTSMNPWRVQSMVKPRSREANMDIKQRSKQANIDVQKEMVQTP